MPSDGETQETIILIIRYSHCGLELEAAVVCLEIKPISGECKV
jgi:hypothetical protein